MNIAAILIVASAVCLAESDRAAPVAAAEKSLTDLPANVRVHLEKLRSKSVDDRLAALGALGKLKDKAAPAVPFLIDTLGDDGMKVHLPRLDPITGRDMGPPWEEFVWQAASWALGQVGKSAVGPLLEAADDENRTVRFRALYTLVGMKEPKAVEPLIDLLGDPKATKRWEIARLLGRTGDARAVEPLMNYLVSQGSDSFSPQIALEALEKIGRAPKDLTPILKTLEAKDRMIRAQTAVTLGKMKDLRALQPLIRTLETDPDAWVRGAAAEGLGNLGDPRAVDPLVEFAKDPQVDRTYAVLALGRIGEKEATDTLLGLLDDESRRVRDCAAYALRGIDDRRIVPEIIKRLEDTDYHPPYSAYDTLETLTGQKFAGRREKWLKWWAENRETFLKNLKE